MSPNTTVWVLWITVVPQPFPSGPLKMELLRLQQIVHSIDLLVIFVDSFINHLLYNKSESTETWPLQFSKPKVLPSDYFTVKRCLVFFHIRQRLASNPHIWLINHFSLLIWIIFRGLKRCNYPGSHKKYTARGTADKTDMILCLFSHDSSDLSSLPLLGSWPWTLLWLVNRRLVVQIPRSTAKMCERN